MAWGEDSTPTRQQSRIGVGLPGAAVLEAAGYPLNWLDRLRLGWARITGRLEPVESLPEQVFGIPVKGRNRMEDLIETLRPFVSRPNFGKNENDVNDVLDAFAQRNLGLGPRDTEQASNLLKVYRRAIAKKHLEDAGVFEVPEEEQAQGLRGVLQKLRN